MSLELYPAHLAPYPSDRFLAVQRVAKADYPAWDGLCLKVGPLALSLNWKRRV